MEHLNNNNNNNTNDNIYGAVIVAKATARVHPVHVMKLQCFDAVGWAF